jgi:hypothetical protein
MDFASAHAASIITDRQLQERRRELERRRRVLARAAAGHTPEQLAPRVAIRVRVARMLSVHQAN